MFKDVKEIRVEDFYGEGTDLLLTSKGNILKEITGSGLRVAKSADGQTLARIMFRIIENMDDFNIKEKLSPSSEESKF